jgi:hypothetical protein
MTYFSFFSLQRAIFSLLTNDAALMADISGIYDFVPDDAAYPFIAIGEHQLRDWSNLQQEGTQQQVTIRVFTREAGRKQAVTLMERVVQLMHGQPLVVSGNEVRNVRLLSSQVNLLEDGRTYRGTLNFRVLLSVV